MIDFFQRDSEHITEQGVKTPEKKKIQRMIAIDTAKKKKMVASSAKI